MKFITLVDYDSGENVYINPMAVSSISSDDRNDDGSKKFYVTCIALGGFATQWVQESPEYVMNLVDAALNSKFLEG